MTSIVYDDSTTKKNPPKSDNSDKLLNLQMQTPVFEGSTSGLLQSGKTEEKYVIIWTADREQVFEMPTSGSAIMRQGINHLYLAKKEQCLAFATQLKTIFNTTNYEIYRLLPNREIQYLHPKDNMFPEDVNSQRVGGNINHSIGKNPQPVSIKFTNKNTFDE